ncbi:MAG: zinc-binding dehydrogenase [Armatimonadota bacterium]|nr:MAG: zinc-binding dehydrogenase [Armatimonadota bacterium]
MKTDAMVLVEPGRIDITQLDVPDPGPGEVLIEVKANGICKGDIALFTGEINYGYPFFHGHEPAGIVAAVGPGVNGLQPGDKVACLGSPSYRKHYIAHSYQIAKIPDQSADLALWISEPPACAVHGAQASDCKLGDKVALLGCGYMGLLVLQALPRETFSRLIVTDPAKARRALALSLGAPEAYDPTTTDLSALAQEIGGFDVVIEASGEPGTISTATQMLRTGGTLNIFGWHAGEELVPTHDWHYKGLKVLNSSPMLTPDFTPYFRASVALMATGRIDQKPLITHRFPLEESQRALEVAAGKENDYVKGVITF